MPRLSLFLHLTLTAALVVTSVGWARAAERASVYRGELEKRDGEVVELLDLNRKLLQRMVSATQPS